MLRDSGKHGVKTTVFLPKTKPVASIFSQFDSGKYGVSKRVLRDSRKHGVKTTFFCQKRSYWLRSQWLQNRSQSLRFSVNLTREITGSRSECFATRENTGSKRPFFCQKRSYWLRSQWLQKRSQSLRFLVNLTREITGSRSECFVTRENTGSKRPFFCQKRSQSLRFLVNLTRGNTGSRSECFVTRENTGSKRPFFCQKRSYWLRSQSLQNSKHINIYIYTYISSLVL